jgi:hypothetical protein
MKTSHQSRAPQASRFCRNTSGQLTPYSLEHPLAPAQKRICLALCAAGVGLSLGTAAWAIWLGVPVLFALIPLAAAALFVVQAVVISRD